MQGLKRAAVLIAAPGLLALGLALPASASTDGCAFTNGCATLQGVDAAGHAVAMDAKKQSSATGTLIIGYPDKPGDGATNFVADLHYATTRPTTSGNTYTDTALTANFASTAVSDQIAVTSSNAGGTTTVGFTCSGFASQGTDPVTISPAVVTTPASVLCDTTGHDFTFATPTVTTTYNVATSGLNGSKAVAVVTVNPANTTNSVDELGPSNLNTPNSVYATGIQFSGTNIVSWAGDNLPAGSSITPSGLMSADTTVPDSYPYITVTGSDSAGAQISQKISVTVVGVLSTIEGTNTPYWTFIYAKNGVWSSQCVTDIGGSGALVLTPCTLGHNRYQDFFALGAGGTPSAGLTDGGQFYLQNWLQQINNPGSSCLTDPSSLSPGTPQTNAVDTAGAPNYGRQLRTDGSCTSTQDKWVWAS